jgi:serine/threonine protein kinase
MASPTTVANQMTRDLWQRLKQIFDAAMDRPAEERAAFIVEASGGDVEFQQHLLQLVEAAQRETDTLDKPLVDWSNLPSLQTNRFLPGDIVLGRFRIVRPIGRGGMGEVYQAEDLQLGTIALKTIRPTILSSPAAYERFRQEVQVARKVSGKQVCRIHELFLLPASGANPATAFLTMEYIEGLTLSEKLQKDGALTGKQALHIALEVCEGLRLIHAQGVIHRDLKSSNIMLCKLNGEARTVLMDFGLAHDLSSESESDANAFPLPRGLSAAGAIMGTPEYMAPEQFEGKPVSPATDIYAFGIVLYEMLTALHPYAAPTPVGAAIRRAQHPRSPSSLQRSVPRHWDRVIDRCLEYDPARRFQSAAEVAGELKAGPASLRNLRQDRPWTIWLGSAVVLATFAWCIFLGWRSGQYYHPSAEAQKWYDTGLSSLREGNYVKATRSLEAAIGQDNHFVMAHARLAEAWVDLDFQGNAQRELLLAIPDQRRLTPLDRTYVNAIRATVDSDFFGAVDLYRNILAKSPAPAKPAGCVDLGMAYERAGNPTRALESYAKATFLDPDSPAPYLHTAILQSRLHRVPEANQTFQHVQTLFTAEMNQEGLAELDYQRGYAANDNGDSATAQKFLESSLREAEAIPSVQLEIKVLTQLSSVSYHSDRDAQAVEQANRAIRLARDNQLDSWAADGLVRLANAQLDQGNLKEVDDPLQEAFQLVHQSPQPRVEAMANLTLASLNNQRHLPDQVIAPAQAALDYYKQNGFFARASTAGILLVRAERDKGQYQQALTSGNELLFLVTQSDDHANLVQAEELVGSVYLAKEDFPQALAHFQKARAAADTDSMRSFEALRCADALWRLGQYADADSLFATLSGNATFMERVARVQVASLLSRRQYQPALLLAQKTMAGDPTMQPGWKQTFEQNKAIAEAHLGQKKQALDYVALIKEKPADDPEDKANQELVAAEIYLAAGMPQQAYDSAAPAQQYFASSSKPDSELHSAYLAESAAISLNDAKKRADHAAIIVDITQKLEQTWSPETFQIYLSRPDLSTLRQGTLQKAR